MPFCAYGGCNRKLRRFVTRTKNWNHRFCFKHQPKSTMPLDRCYDITETYRNFVRSHAVPRLSRQRTMHSSMF